MDSNQEQPINALEKTKQDSLNKLATAATTFIKQGTWQKRLSGLLKFVAIIYIIVLITLTVLPLIQKDSTMSGSNHMAVVNLVGPIMPSSDASAEIFNPLLHKAFANESSKAVVIKANSPGGSPVQSALINAEITRLKTLYKKPVYVVVEDMCASGCYYIAVAADKIFANKGSMVGSIGVRMDTFGFTGLMEKIGIQNRSMHAGEHKTFIDPFSPEDIEGREFFQTHVLERTHQQFIETVKQGRGERLKVNKNTFTGLVWLGDEAVKNGLIDGLGDIGFVQREIVKTQNKLVYENDQSFIEQMMAEISSEVSLLMFNSLSGLK